MKNPAKNPQTRAAGAITVAGVIVGWGFHKIGLTVPQYYAIGIAGAAWTVLTWIGREGLVGVWDGILHGFGKTKE